MLQCGRTACSQGPALWGQAGNEAADIGHDPVPAAAFTLDPTRLPCRTTPGRGRHGRGRRVAVRQTAQFSRQYAYVAVAIDPLTGRLWWAWQASMKGAEVARIWGLWAQDSAIDGWVWDGAGGHQGEEMQAVDAPWGGAAALCARTESGRALLPGTAPGHRGQGLSDPTGQAGGPGGTVSLSLKTVQADMHGSLLPGPGWPTGFKPDFRPASAGRPAASSDRGPAASGA